MASPSNNWATGESNGFPRAFGNYLLLASFAQGGMGELFLAMNGSIAGAFRLCVVKKLRADLTNDKEYVNRFIDEARVVVQLNHANISHVFDIGRIEGQYYLAMEYVGGVSVKALMSRAAELKTAIPEDIAIMIAREVLEALDYAHEHSHPITGEALHVVHRDVSPQNVLVSWGGEVKLIDFGLALSALKDEHTQTGAVMGKVAYMPPEQARGEEVGASCDQFASAIVTYEMIANDRYHGDLPLHAIWAIAGMGNFPPPRWSKLSKPLQTILQKALHNDPYKRYATCGDLREALGGYMAAHHPTTSGRALRDLLESWFKDQRKDERELLAQFKDVTGSTIREAVKATGVAAESLISGVHRRPEEWEMPPTEADKPEKAAPPSESRGVTLGQPKERLDESRSLRLMPPPVLGAQVTDALADAAAALLVATPPPDPHPILAPPVPVAAAAGAPLPALVTFATVGESTERFERSAAISAAAATLTVLVPAEREARTVLVKHESTERVNRNDDDDLDFDPSRKRMWPLAAAAVAAVAVVVVLIVAGSSDPKPIAVETPTTVPTTTTPIAVPTTTPTTVPTTTTTVATTTTTTTTTPATTPTTTTPTATTAPTTTTPTTTTTTPNTTTRVNKVRVTPTTTTTTPVETVPVETGESREVSRARVRVEKLRQSACKDPCVAQIVGQLDSMPGAIELDGFRTSVSSCLDACTTAP